LPPPNDPLRPDRRPAAGRHRQRLGGDLNARHRHDYTGLANEFGHSHPDLERDAVRDAEQRYWWLIRPASGAIRRSWLAAIKRRAERPADGQGESE
jgi:hypothetical protein